MQSDGTKVENPRFLLKEEKKLKRTQKKLSRMKQGSNNWKKQRQNVQQLHIKVANQRRDFLHKRSYHLSKTRFPACPIITFHNCKKGSCAAIVHHG
ncbi:transposase [Salicibibacter kimchii]|uniref:transposase n=1 Tax=Salicibibacter kimchii TaxID=2099786 RepID=UPI003AAC1B76